MSVERYGMARPGLPPGVCTTCGGHGYTFEQRRIPDGISVRCVDCDACSGMGGSSPSAVEAERKRFAETKARVRAITAAAWERVEAMRAKASGGGE